MHRRGDLTQITSIAIPRSILAELNQLTGPRERSRFMVDAIRDAIAERKAQQKMNEASKYQAPLPLPVTQ